jgi:hypothetical protein
VADHLDPVAFGLFATWLHEGIASDGAAVGMTGGTIHGIEQRSRNIRTGELGHGKELCHAFTTLNPCQNSVSCHLAMTKINAYASR